MLAPSQVFSFRCYLQICGRFCLETSPERPERSPFGGDHENIALQSVTQNHDGKLTGTKMQNKN